MYLTIFQRIFIVVSLLSFSLGIQAKTGFNSGEHQYTRGYIILSGRKPQIYLLKNISHRRVLVDRELRFDPGASAGWASIIAPGRWSAIFITQPTFKMNCMAKNRHNIFRKVCCKRWIQVIPVKKFTARSSLLKGGSFWIAENKPYMILKKRIKARGFNINVTSGTNE